MDFTQPWEFGDGVFVLEDKKIYVSKAVLAMSSAVFSAMFTSEFKEKKMIEIPLPDKKFDDFVVLMQAVHPPHTTLADKEMENNVECLLPLAHEYQMHHVVENCDKYLLTQPPSIHNLILADKFSLEELRDNCIEYIKDIPLMELDKDPDFKHVESHSLVEVYRYKSELREGAQPSKEVICNLMTQPPSIENLLLADKYHLPLVYEKCLEYVQDTPMSVLKDEPGFEELKLDILKEVLFHQNQVLTDQMKAVRNKNKELSPKAEALVKLKARITNIYNYREYDAAQNCTNDGKYQAHHLGSSKCPSCAQFNFKKLFESLGKY